MEEVKNLFKKTVTQIKAVQLLASAAVYICLFGGSRSGKTFICIYALIVRASKTKSRHVVFRRTFNSLKRSIWMDTLPKVLHICFPDLEVKFDKTNFVVFFPNGSEIWFAGLDSGDRVEKILGMEFSTIYFNETSEIPYDSVTLVMSRLAQNSGLVNKCYFDMNPPTKKHWTYSFFIKKIDPIDNKPLQDPELYQSLLMNPKDNQENLGANYLKILERLPEEQKKRFLYGEFKDGSDGEAYYAFDREKHVQPIPEDTLNKGGQILIGQDYNVDPGTAVVAKYINNKFYIYNEVYLRNSDTYKVRDALVRQGNVGTLIPDHTGGNRKTSGKSDFAIMQEAGFQIAAVFNPHVLDRVNNINRLLSEGRIIIDPRCEKLIADLEKVVWKDNQLDQKTDKTLTHISDALGYLCWKIAPIQIVEDDPEYHEF